MKTPRKDTRWHVVKCPRSFTPIDCGYYVWKFMRDIIRRGSSIILLKWFSGEDYKTQDIVEIQREWLDNLFALIMREGDFKSRRLRFMSDEEPTEIDSQF